MPRLTAPHRIGSQPSIAGWLAGACALALGWTQAACDQPAEPGAPALAAAAAPSASSARSSSDPQVHTPGAKRILARLEFPTANGGEAKPAGLLAADLDGDGRDELIACVRGPGGIEIWSALSSALTAAIEPRRIPIGDYPLGPVWFGARLPASKSAELLVAVSPRAAPAELVIVDVRGAFLGKRADPIVWRVPLARRARVIAAGDLGADGVPEVAVITIDDDLLLLHGQDRVEKLRLSEPMATCMRFLEDGSGLVIGFQGTRRVAVYRAPPAGDASSAFIVQSAAVELSGLPRDLDELDVDGDGDRELLVAGGDKSIWVFGLSRPGGPVEGMQRAPSELETGTIPIDLEHADFDRDGHDGHDEVLAINLFALSFRLFRWTRAGLEVRQDAYAGQAPWDGAIGDFDGDGALDLAVSNPDAKRVSVLFGDGEGSLTSAPRASTDRQPHSMDAGDLDGDGLPEIVGLNALDGTLTLFKNQHGTLSPAARQGQPKSADAVRIAELDGDGKPDAAFLQRTDKEASLAVVFGDGEHLWERAAFPPVPYGRSSGDLLLGDIDGDGRSDAVITDPEANRVVLLQNETAQVGDLRFSAPRILEIQSGPKSLAWIAPPGSGAPSIAVALSGPGQRLGIALLRTKKSASGEVALEEAAFLATKEQPLWLCSADIDGDGRLDIALLASESGPDSRSMVIPWLQTQDGAWRALAPLPTGLRPYHIAAGDIDGDGRADIFVTAQNSHQVNAWLSKPGDPPAFVRTADLGAGTGPLDVKLVDLDHDGHLELIVANGFSNDLSVIRVR